MTFDTNLVDLKKLWARILELSALLPSHRPTKHTSLKYSGQVGLSGSVAFCFLFLEALAPVVELPEELGSASASTEESSTEDAWN